MPQKYYPPLMGGIMAISSPDWSRRSWSPSSTYSWRTANITWFLTSANPGWRASISLTAAMLLFLAAQKWSQREFLLFQRFLQNTTLPPGTRGPSRQGNLAGYSGRGSLICFNIDWFDLLAPQSTQESSLAPQFKSIKSSLLNIFGPTLIAIYDCWKNW